MCDSAAGTFGFLVNASQHLLETHTDPRDLTYDAEGYPHGVLQRMVVVGYTPRGDERRL